MTRVKVLDKFLTLSRLNQMILLHSRLHLATDPLLLVLKLVTMQSSTTKRESLIKDVEANLIMLSSLSATDLMMVTKLMSLSRTPGVNHGERKDTSELMLTSVEF